MNRIYTFIEYWDDDEEDEIKISLLVDEEDVIRISIEMHEAFDNWMCGECENSILIEDGVTPSMLLQQPIGDYILMWLDKLNIQYKELKDEQLNFKLYIVVQTHEDKNAIRDFDIKLITDNINLAEKKFNDLFERDTYGYFSRNGLENKCQTLIESKYINGFESIEIKEVILNKVY